MPNWFFVTDIAVALAMPLVYGWLRRSRCVPASVWSLYWVGCAIGLTWELGYYVTGPRLSDDPSWVATAEFPLPAILQPLLHTLCDGGLFAAGLLLVFALCRPPQLVAFRWAELLVLVGWGQVQELGVELLATGAGTWYFTPRWWNPVLFVLGASPITLAPQVIWLVAPVVFYLVALRVHRAVTAHGG